MSQNCPRCGGMVLADGTGFDRADGTCMACGAVLYGEDQELPKPAIPVGRGKRREPGHVKRLR